MNNEPTKRPASLLPPLRVLVADDSPTFVEALCNFLARLTAVSVVAIAADGQNAVALLAEHRPDLVIMDVSMPRMNGPEAAAEMRRLLPDVRIIMVSIHQDAETQAESIQEIAGLFPHLTENVLAQ